LTDQGGFIAAAAADIVIVIVIVITTAPTAARNIAAVAISFALLLTWPLPLHSPSP